MNKDQLDAELKRRNLTIKSEFDDLFKRLCDDVTSAWSNGLISPWELKRIDRRILSKAKFFAYLDHVVSGQKRGPKL